MTDAFEVREAVVADAPRIADLHASRIGEGFLTFLGTRFLTRLYRRVVRSPHAFAVVVVEQGVVVAFAAASDDVRNFYKEFVIRDGVLAGLGSAPRVIRSIPRVLETLRYPALTADLPRAEILSVATDGAVTGRGYGSVALTHATRELERRGCMTAKVVTGATNDSALRLYHRNGFATHTEISVHGDVTSEVLVWASS
ncbi:MAG TPA: GNAT family N-acetyltransferase [Acidimicrobiia bacterium]|nr:GNAT family N-acetyltransferase [Acidimicrobiia bacterium]